MAGRNSTVKARRSAWSAESITIVIAITMPSRDTTASNTLHNVDPSPCDNPVVNWVTSSIPDPCPFRTRR